MALGREDILEEANWRHRLFQTNAVLFGAGCPPDFVVKWILSSQTWAPEKTATA